MALKTPTFIFDAAVTKTHTYPDIGLSNFGPYDSYNFEPKTPNILCICNGNNRGFFTKLLSDLKDGNTTVKIF
jgi:hypothetical protein